MPVVVLYSSIISILFFSHNKSDMARTCILLAFGLKMSCRLSLVLRLFLKKNLNASSRPPEHPLVSGKTCQNIYICQKVFCFVFGLDAFTEAVALRSIVLCSSICMHAARQPHVFLPFVVVVVFTIKTVLTSIQYLLFLTLQGKETNFRGHKLTQNKVQKNKIK